MSKTDFTERLAMYRDANMINDQDVADVNSVIRMFHDVYHVDLCEENADTFIAHLCMAYMRNTTKEEVPPLTKDNIAELAALPTYSLSLEILDNMQKVTKNSLTDVEKNYVLLHLNNLIQKLKDQGEWPGSDESKSK